MQVVEAYNGVIGGCFKVISAFQVGYLCFDGDSRPVCLLDGIVHCLGRYIHAFYSLLACQSGWNLLRRSELETTVRELAAMAAAASMGLRNP